MNESKTFSSEEELVRDEKLAILFPTWLPENEKITKCWYFSDITSGGQYIFQCQNPKYSMTVYLETTISEKIKAEIPINKIGDLIVYIISEEDVVQGMFEHNGYFYAVNVDTEENLLKIIENLKEIE